MRIERFFTQKGYEYKSNANTTIIKANYTLGLRLRKIYAINENGDCTYILKQEDRIKKMLYNFIRFIYSTETIPNYILYKNNIKIGNTEYFKSRTLPIKTTEFDLSLVKDMDKKNHIIRIMENNDIIAEIFKSRLRFGKKNIYNVFYNNWKYDKDFLMLLTALCDLVFFPEWRLLRWDAMEYDLFEYYFD